MLLTNSLPSPFNPTVPSSPKAKGGLGVLPYSKSIPFAGLGMALHRSIAKLEAIHSKKPGSSHKAGSNIKLGGSQYEWTKMTEHTLGSTGSRLLVSNSLAERVEVAVTETIEGLIVFFGLSALVNKTFAPMVNKLAKINTAEEKALAKKALDKIPVAKLTKQLPARLAAIVGAIGTTLFAGEFGMLFAKNLGTIALFNKGSFSEVLSLHNGEDAQQREETIRTSTKGLLISIGAGLATLGAAVGIAKKGPAIVANMSKSRLKKLQQRLSKFDFDFKDPRKTYGLGNMQLATYMGLSGVGYMLAARDNLERWEIAPRFTLIFAYLVAFKDLFDKHLLYPFFHKRVPELFKQDEKGNLSVKSVEELTPVIDKATKSKKRKLVAGKNSLFLAPYIVGMLLVSLANAAINRYLTFQRFERQQHEAQAKASFEKLAPLQHGV